MPVQIQHYNKKLIKHFRMKDFRIFVLNIIIFFTSCDPGVDYICSVQNDSDYDVKAIVQIFSPWYLDGKDTLYNLPDTIVVNKKTSSTIFTDGRIGCVYEYENCNFVQYDSISMLVFLVDTVKIIPNIHSKAYIDYWDFRVIKEYRNGGGTCECRMILTNDMLLNNNE